jgi:predicted dehydrogenase
MKQVVQPVSGGQVQVLDVPAPVISPDQVLVRTVASVIFPGTERAGPAAANRPTGPDRPACLGPSAVGRPLPGIGWIGVGAFSARTLLPAFRAAGFARFVAVATASGVSARREAKRHGFEKAMSGPAAVINDPDVGVVVIATPHDVHEELASRALAAGRDVWCAKPLVLTYAGLDEVEKAWRDSGRHLTLGFNRRWAPAVQAARRLLAQTEGPKLVVYRIAAAPVSDEQWHLDRRQGGRLVGEVCHFVDLAQALVGADLDDAAAVLAGGTSRGNDGVAVALRFTDGSVGSIAYGSTPLTAGKERIEVLAGSNQVIIDDFRVVLENGRTVWEGQPDKGHRAHATAFRQAVEGGPDLPTAAMLHSMRTTLRATGEREDHMTPARHAEPPDH